MKTLHNESKEEQKDNESVLYGKIKEFHGLQKSAELIESYKSQINQNIRVISNLEAVNKKLTEAIEEERSKLEASVTPTDANDNSHQANLEHRNIMEILAEQYNTALIEKVKAAGFVLSKDGNAWCALHGPNPVEGLCFFDETYIGVVKKASDYISRGILGCLR